MEERKGACDLTEAAWNVIKEDETANELVSFGAYVAFKRFFERSGMSESDAERGVISQKSLMEIRERMEDFLEAWIKDVMLYRFEDSADCSFLAYRAVKDLYPCLYSKRQSCRAPDLQAAPIQRPAAVVEVQGA